MRRLDQTDLVGHFLRYQLRRAEVEIIDDLLERDEVELTAKLSARDLGAVGELVGVELPPVGPVEFAARLRGSDESLTAENVRLRLGETRLRGRFAGSIREGERPALRASIESPHVRLRDVGHEHGKGL